MYGIFTSNWMFKIQFNCFDERWARQQNTRKSSSVLAWDLLTPEERQRIGDELERMIFRPKDERPDSFFDTSHTQEADVVTLDDLMRWFEEMGWSPNG
jgi:hypothetical protein